MQTLSEAEKAIHKAYGKEAGGKNHQYPKFQRLPTGIFTLDLSLGGGLPMGAISIVYGNESSGKTSLCLRTVAQFQTRHPKKKVVWIDVENSWDAQWSAAHGIDTSAVYLFKPTTAEEAADMAAEVALSEDVGLIVVDSIAALASIDQLEKSAEQAIVAGATKPTISMMRKLGRGITEHSKAGQLLTVLYINQPRMKIGFVMGNPEILPGPDYQNYQAFLKLRLTGKPILKDKIASTPIYMDNSMRVVKKKFPCVRQTCEWQTIIYPHAGHKLLEVNNRKHAERILEELGYIAQPDKKKPWELFDVRNPANGELLEFKTKTEAMDYAMGDYDALLSFLVEDMLLLYKDDLVAQMKEAEKAGHK